MSPSYTKGNHRPWRLKKKRKKKIMKANKKSNKCVRGLTITRLVDSVVHDTNMELHTLVSPRLHFEISHQSANQRPHWTQHVEALFLKFIPSPSSKTTFCFCQGSVRDHPYWIGGTDIYNITLRARFKRNSGKEKIQRLTITKRRYFPGCNKLAVPIQFSNSLRDAIVLVFGDKFLLRNAFRGLGFPRNTCLLLRIFFLVWFRSKFRMCKSVIFY